MSTLTEITSLQNGAKFYRADLHIHSYGASHDVKDKTMTPEAIIKTAIAENIDIIALTDHNEISNVDKVIEAAKGTSVFVIPGIELSTPQGHLLCYLPDLQTLQTFHGRLDIGDSGKNTSHCKNAIWDCFKILNELKGFAILAHIDGDGGLEKSMPGGATPHKTNIICDKALLAIELISPTSDISYANTDPVADRVSLGVERTKKLGLGQLQYLARVLNSDAHALKMIGRNNKGHQKITRIKMDTPSFDGVRIAFEDADARIRIEDEIPASIPYVLGMAAEGGFLDGLKIHFSPNLNCIIGGRGTGKSTTFEGIRRLIKDSTLGDAVDSEIWPDHLHLYWKDQAEQTHTLHRPINGNISNVDDPKNGPNYFEIESYRQGETTEISLSTKKEPTALLPYLDRFTNVSTFESEENIARDDLLSLWSQIEEARKYVATIPDCEKDLETKTKQLGVLAKAKASEIIKLQRSLEEERQVRINIATKLSEMKDNFSNLDSQEDIKEITTSMVSASMVVGGLEFKEITTLAQAYSDEVKKVNDKGLETFTNFQEVVSVQLDAWKAKENATEKKIDDEKKKLTAQGIRLDMAFIQKLAADEVKLKTKLKNLGKWKVHLSKLEKQYLAASKKRWEARERVAMARVGYAKIASETLRSVLKDLTVSLKFVINSYSPEAEEQVISAMGWKTSQVPRASLLIEKITLPRLIEAIDQKDYKPILSVKTEEGVSIFNTADAKKIIETLSEPSVRFALERSELFDIPKLTVTGMITRKDGTTQALVKDFTKLSLGQQQSVLLSLMLSAKSNMPLIIDQPEDHLDSEFIYRTLVPVLRQAKERRQIIIVTHNPNIAVLGDAEQIIVLKSTSEKSSVVSSGSIDDPSTRDITCNVLEGAKEAFNRRAKIYQIS